VETRAKTPEALGLTNHDLTILIRLVWGEIRRQAVTEKPSMPLIEVLGKLIGAQKEEVKDAQAKRTV